MMIDVPHARPPSLKEQHARKCFLLGITDRERIAALWKWELARRAKDDPNGRRARRANR